MNAPPPFDVRDPRVRALFARQVTVSLRKTGAATVDQLYAQRFALLGVPMTLHELTQVLEIARRYGWIEQRSPGYAPEWAVTDAGLLVTPPETLELSQVVGRILRIADPAR